MLVCAYVLSACALTSQFPGSLQSSEAGSTAVAALGERLGTQCNSEICLILDYLQIRRPVQQRFLLIPNVFVLFLIFRSSVAPLSLTLSTSAEMLDQVDVFIFDCDGVIWKGDSVLSPYSCDNLVPTGACEQSIVLTPKQHTAGDRRCA
jgi:hypothetical protein